MGCKPSEILEELETGSGKTAYLLTEEDFKTYYPVDIQIEQFERSFSTWFARYMEKLRGNLHQQYNLKSGAHNHALSDADFLKVNGEAPWLFTNEILAEAKLSFEVEIPSMEMTDNLQARLLDRHSGKEIPMEDISSGEKVILSLATAISYSSSAQSSNDLPIVLLLDEIDAPLHPSMTAYMLSVIDSVLVKRRGLVVIMATHSPSTIALCPEESIYQLKKSKTSKSLKKISKDDALVLLTMGLPTLSISHKKRRQVFVESYNDAALYEELYEQVKHHKIRTDDKHLESISTISLSFHGSGGSQIGDCKMVRDHVNALRGNGNEDIFGIIDWDLKNGGNEGVFVLAEQRRYSIENVLLDPLLVGLLRWSESACSASDIGLPETTLLRNISSLDNQQLQNVANIVISKLASVTEEDISNDTIECGYLGGAKLNLPKWILHEQGHDLAKLYRKAFPDLQKYSKDKEFMLSILEKVSRHQPELIPSEIPTIFLKLTGSLS